MKYEIRRGSTDITIWCDCCQAKDGRAVATWDIDECYINFCLRCLLEAAIAVAEVESSPMVKGESK